MYKGDKRTESATAFAWDWDWDWDGEWECPQQTCRAIMSGMYWRRICMVYMNRSSTRNASFSFNCLDQ